ncbi:unnamed protein product (macronuclear) [Paramecium tetraurelia]|uniref:C2H2-type domain-containing protein n=2 Tax=Paramecium TaxID=5884 RepID=A0E6G1_PARTE|nr:uncharacterized protein GSPATT00003743001 [Paramecium tetraurelia]CAD8141687.1 unnamed protein product [Paramecium octaurelia]CAK90878.1 unnamed protein product [Paramecium tetraurelia]|eukprot:XP_001458275.1 hypothetical protein (macronuclear) [Paramecium tetraurelia strain d4-2]
MSNNEGINECDQQHPIDYYKESIRLYYYNIVLHQHVEQVTQERNEIKQKLLKFQALEDQESELSMEDKRKRNRRSAIEIPRSHVCQIKNCNKSYGSEGSLMQHMKIKHGITQHLDKIGQISDQFKSNE